MVTLVVGAYAPELDQLAGRSDVVVRAIGIGMVDAGIGAGRVLAEVRPDRVILVGSAGVLPGGAASIGDVCAVARATLVERPGEYLPPEMAKVQHVLADPELLALCDRAGLHGVDAASSIGVTHEFTEANRLSRYGSVEHLECYSVLRAAQLMGLPATAILAIANRVGPDAHTEWLKNRLVAERAAQDALVRLLS
jgi:purine-nucleoside phosphorylase